MRIALVLACLCAVLCGCVTMRYPGAYKVEGREFREFKELDDERALKLVALIYNVRADTWEDGIARSISLEEYQNLLAKRNSAYVKKSGIFDIQYEKVKLSSLKNADLIRLYDCLYPKANTYHLDSAAELSETQNAERIVCLTAAGLVVKEMKKRDLTEKAMLIAGQVLSTALMVALSLL